MPKKEPAAPEETISLAGRLLDDVVTKTAKHSKYLYGRKLADSEAGKRLLALAGQAQAQVVGDILGRLAELEPKIAVIRAQLDNYVANPQIVPGWDELWGPRQVLSELVLRDLLRRELPLSEGQVVALLQWPVQASNGVSNVVYPLTGLAKAAECFVAAHGATDRLKAAICDLIAKLREAEFDKACRKIADRLAALVPGGPQIQMEPGEAWSDHALADLQRMSAKARHDWTALLLHCQTGGKNKPTASWLTAAKSLLTTVGDDAFRGRVCSWFALVDKPRTQHIDVPDHWRPLNDLIIPAHVEILKGLAWCSGLRADADLARALAGLAISCYRKVPGIGPRLTSLGNAAVTALGLMPGRDALAQLAILKVRVKFGTAQKEIEKAFLASAQREGLPADEVEELAVPAYGLEDVGVRRAQLGDYQAELLVDGSDARLHWHKDGKPLKSAPAAVKKDHADEFKELQTAVKDIQKMLPAQRERLDTLFLARKAWPLATWRERYLDHPLVGTLARRLIWLFDTPGATTAGMWFAGELVDADGKPLVPKDETTVALWHPIGRAMDEVLAWRQWLERHEICQPFKQAHREVYILTDAERNTRVYSNRFAAHVLRQHQFHALCAARGWKNKLRLMVDDYYPPAHRLLPQWGLRAEFWIEGLGDDYGQDTAPSGAFLYVGTDQVRFYEIEAAQTQAHASGGGYGPGWNRADQDRAEPLPIERVPPLVFAEIMRDVDLFVGVASVGNDPTWADGGPDGRYRDYWQRYAYGDLSASAHTRKALLEKLIPRLAIADRCQFADRFLIVRGDLKTYKIHLGSGNILMSPNDQYLCIVPKQTTTAPQRVFLPFEGDGTLSVVLSKAFMLAADTRITDPTIISQINMSGAPGREAIGGV